MTNNGAHDHSHDTGFPNDGDFADLPDEMEEPIMVKGFSVTYDRLFNIGDFGWLHPAITIWVKTQGVVVGKGYDLHYAKERVRRMARENVRAQLLRQQGNSEVVFLGLQPPPAGGVDPICVRTVSVSLIYKVSLGNNHAITPGYTDWSALYDMAHRPGVLHGALARMWQSLWANIADEISRAQGHGGTGGFFGLPPVPVEDLTTVLQISGQMPAVDGGNS